MERLKSKAKTKPLSVRVSEDFHSNFSMQAERLEIDNSTLLWKRITQEGLKDTDFINTGRFLRELREMKPILSKLLDYELPQEIKQEISVLSEVYTKYDKNIVSFEKFALKKDLDLGLEILNVLLKN